MADEQDHRYGGMGYDQYGEDKSRAAELLYNNHLEAVKEEVELIQREGEMIGQLESAIKEEDFEFMKDYFGKARQIALQKIRMYSDVLKIIDQHQAVIDSPGH